jgi:hypothetical protein
LINKQASPITNFNDEVMKLPASDEITPIDGIHQNFFQKVVCAILYLFSGKIFFKNN